ncbi:MAG TPA: VWA domain-containing protein [Puia sp.]|uniref:VWA domain-containing protein n=1 Tax=Puia sp. TaxID=2045100 RepID=UPI002D0F2D27|nr:VWA domain-containing protein [Puia sp.]HVU98894.1 VWA domain-containing protein [Puia sp.]
MYRLQHSEYLIGLGALPLLVAALYLLIGWKKRTAARMGDPGLVRQLIDNFSPSRFMIKAIVAILAFGVIILAAANPQKPGAMENVQRKGVDVMLVLDVSKSMLAKDIKPSRLDKAKQFMMLLTEKLNNDRIGLILFAGRAYLQMPLTTDHGAARMYIQDAGPDAVPTQGTVIGEALKMANTAFNSKERKYKSIVLISDGEDHDPEALKQAQQLAQSGVMINTVGIGSPEGSPIIDPATNELKKDEQGNTVISKLNEAELQQLSNATNGEYIRLDNVDDALITMSQRIDSAEKKSMSDSEFIDYVSYFQWLAGAALLLLLVEFFLSERRKKKKAAVSLTPAKAAMLVLAILTAALPAAAQSGNAELRSGNRYYKKKQIDQSLRQYQSAVQKAPDNPTANYNLGNAQFRKNNYDEAGHSYDATIKNSANDKGMQEKGYYNKGVSMIKQKKLQESIDAWKEALKLDANDADARENLEKALMQQKQQQQQQQQNKNDQKKEQKEKKEEKKDQQQQEQQQPKPQPSRLNKQQVEQLLKALEQKENDLQNKMKQNKVKAPNQPEKDW